MFNFFSFFFSGVPFWTKLVYNLGVKKCTPLYIGYEHDDKNFIIFDYCKQ